MVTGRLLMVLGLGIFFIGAGIYVGARFGFPFGRLPGDIHIENPNLTCIIPLASTIVLSIILTLILNILLRVINR